MDSREAFDEFVRRELGDVPVMDMGRYISPKINNYWRTWQAATGRCEDLLRQDMLAWQEHAECFAEDADDKSKSLCRAETLQDMLDAIRQSQT